MSEGVLQQIGTPQDVYRRPANVFVATFLGAPPMNEGLQRMEHEAADVRVERRERRRTRDVRDPRTGLDRRRDGSLVSMLIFTGGLFQTESLSFFSTGLPFCVDVRTT